MKQHITVEDLLSLTPAQQERLREWWVPQVGDWFLWREESRSGEVLDIQQCVLIEATEYHNGYLAYAWDADGCTETAPKSECLPLLSMGQCMELLSMRHKSLTIFKMDDECNVRASIDVNAEMRGDWVYRKAPEPLDALFAAVKEVV